MKSEVFNMDCVEIWKDVTILYSFTSDLKKKDKYTFKKGKYKVSNMGRFSVNGKIKKNKCDSRKSITFCLNKHRFKLHQIVLQTFKPKGCIDGYSPDHIDRTRRLDNSLYNLRWADRTTQTQNRENKAYKYKKVYCLNNNTLYNSCQDAEKHLNLVKNTVARVARGERKSIHNYKFIYATA